MMKVKTSEHFVGRHNKFRLPWLEAPAGIERLWFKVNNVIKRITSLKENSKTQSEVLRIIVLFRGRSGLPSGLPSFNRLRNSPFAASTKSRFERNRYLNEKIPTQTELHRKA